MEENYKFELKADRPCLWDYRPMPNELQTHRQMPPIGNTFVQASKFLANFSEGKAEFFPLT